MAKLSHTDSRRMYSWWWDSHISPKNSKWLQENLTGMDAKVKAMIKLIEEDADSFARRAEMYYKKRPELMKLVEEFYRAYRSLAERYDHATGVIRHAHRTMTEAFPNQAPLIFTDDSLANSVPETDPRTPELSTPAHVLGEDDDMRNKAFKQFHDPFGSVVRVRKGLNFDEAAHNNHVRDIKLSKPDQECESEEILSLKEGLAKLEAEKEAGLVSYQQSLDRLSQLESEITQTREDFQVLSDNATKAENEVVVLKEALTKLETEKESTLQEYQRCLDRITELQNIIFTSEEDAQKFKERAFSAETESQSLKGQLDKLTVEKDAALHQYMQSLEMISNLESKLRLTDEDALRLKERAESAERNVETLKQTISKLTEEKEASALQYQQCLETISSLEHKLACAQEEAKHLNVEMDSGVSKLKDAEEKCLTLERSNLSLHSELDSLMLKMGTQDQELSDKKKELGRLWACIQEERLRFVEAETAFQTLQHLHAQTQEEVWSMASDLQNRAQLLKVAEIRNQSLEDEALRFKEENKHLDELNASSASSIKDLRNEIYSLKESKGKLVEEVDLRLDQRNALQQEIYCLKEELNDLNMKHRSVSDEVLRVGLNPESLGSSVKELQDENFNLKETRRRESSDKAALLEKLKILEQLLVKNSILETSLSDLNAELKTVRGNLEALEQSCKSLREEKSTLLGEKATLMTQFQETNKNLEKLTENNNVLVNLLSDALFQLESFKAKSKILEDSCQLLVNEKAGLITENDGLTFQLENTQIRLENLRKIYGELERRFITLEEERELTSHKVEELQKYLEVERQERTDYIQMSEARFGVVESERLLLHEENQLRRGDFDQMLEKAINNEIEIFVLRVTAQEMEENNCTLLMKNLKFLEESSLSEKRISELEQHKFEQEVETKSLFHQVNSLRAGSCQLLKVLDIVENHACKDKTEQDQIYANMLLSKLQRMKESLREAEKENQQWRIELSALITWIRLQRLEAQNLEEKNSIEHEFKFRDEQLLVLQTEFLEVLKINEKLRSEVMDGDSNKEALILQIEDLSKKLIHMQSTCQHFHREKLEISEEKRSLMNNYLQLEANKNVLEEENDALCGEVFALDNFSLIFRSCADEKFTALRELGDNLNRLHDMNAALAEKLSLTQERLEGSKTETCHLKERLQRSENEFKVIVTVKDQLINEIQSGKTMLHQMEIELQEAEQKISLVEKEKIELDKTVEDLRVEYSDVKKVRDFQQIQILKLSADNDHLSRENNSLLEASQMLEAQLYELHGENGKRKRQEDTLHIDLQKKIDEIDNLENQAASVFCQLQYSMVSQLLYEQKFQELHEACLGYINQNEDLKTKLAAYGPEIASLKECLSSLENHTDLHIKFQNPDNEDSQGAQVKFDDNGSNLSEDKKTLMAPTFYDLRDLRARLQAIEKAAVEIKELMAQENVDLRFKLDASMRQVELLKSESGRYRRSWKRTSEISEADNPLLTKDIVLDQISDGSSFHLSKREPVDIDNQIVELWETSDPDGTIGLTVGKSKKAGTPLALNKSTDFHRVKSMKKQKGEFRTSGTQIEKELSVDKSEVSQRYPEPLQEGNRRKVLERLDSDVQKLANLQITVQDLKRKLEVTEKGKRGKAVVECEALKTQLEEADIAIIKLFDLNSRLMKSIENSTLKSSADPVGDGSSRRRRIPEQARRMSEKIGRLQLEVQKLQFVLLKLDGEKEGKTNMSETKRRILLRDYLYGAGRTGERQKKAQFCACVQPPVSSSD